MSRKLPPCDHDECPPSHCKRPGSLDASAGSLLSCPFCGGEAEEFGFPGEMWVRCKSCRVMMPDDGPLDSHLAAWNLRTENGGAERIGPEGGKTT